MAWKSRPVADEFDVAAGSPVDVDYLRTNERLCTRYVSYSCDAMPSEDVLRCGWLRRRHRAITAAELASNCGCK